MKRGHKGVFASDFGVLWTAEDTGERLPLSAASGLLVCSACGSLGNLLDGRV
jgi:hypothetical protein